MECARCLQLAFLLILSFSDKGVASQYDPWINNSPSSPPIRSLSTRLIYEQMEQVTLECHPPYGSRAQVQWGNVNIIEGNYAFPNALIKYTKNENQFPIQLTIMYSKERWINRVNVSCYSTAVGLRSNSSSVIIEQIYPTSNVVINDGGDKIRAKPDQMVTLECKADGNPNSTYGFWYNKTESGIFRMAESGRSISFKYWNGTKAKYACQGRNFYRGYPFWVNSSWVEVVNSGFVLQSSFFLSIASLFLASQIL